MQRIIFADGSYKVAEAMEQYWNDTQYSFEKTERPLWGLMLVIGGTVRFECPRPFVAQEGDLILLPKGAHYRSVMKKGVGATRDLLINFDTDVELLTERIPIKIMQSTPVRVYELISKIVRGQLGVVSKLRISADFYALLDEINHAEKEDVSLVSKAMRLIVQSPDMPISEIARECGVCESGLRSTFKKKVGVSPARFRTVTKINRAKYLLQSGCSVKEIAGELGFYDEAYFCRTFKEITGLSPKQYRARMRL